MSDLEAIRESWQTLLGPITPDERGRPEVVPDLDATGPVQKSRMGFPVVSFSLKTDEDDITSGKWIEPEGAAKGIIIAAHQTTEPPDLGSTEVFGIKGKASLRYGEDLAARGYIVLGIEYPGFGGNQTDAYKLGFSSVSAKGLWNHICLIRAAQKKWPSLAKKIAVIGHSLGGTNALLLGAFLEQKILVVASAALTTWCDFANMHGSLARWARRDKYMPAFEDLYENDPDLVPTDLAELTQLIHPSPLFVSVAVRDEIFPFDGARKVVEATKAYYTLRGTPDRFEACQADTVHDFSDGCRNEAYDFVERFIDPNS